MFILKIINKYNFSKISYRLVIEIYNIVLGE